MICSNELNLHRILAHALKEAVRWNVRLRVNKTYGPPHSENALICGGRQPKHVAAAIHSLIIQLYIP